MKVLSVRWPWCLLILAGGKDVENRSRALIRPENIPAGGLDLLIHCPASSGPDLDWWRGFTYCPVSSVSEEWQRIERTILEQVQALESAREAARPKNVRPFNEAAAEALDAPKERDPFVIWEAVAGQIIGQVKLVGVERDSKSPWAQDGQVHHLLAEPQLWTPDQFIPARGKLGLWEYRP